MFKNGKTIDQIPLERLTATCHVINALHGPLSLVTLDDVLPYENEVQPGDFVFFNTGWGPKFHDKDYFESSSISMEAAQWLVDKKVGIVGIDCSTIDITYCLRTPEFDFPVHHLILGNEVLVIELLNLSEVAGKKLKVCCYALNIVGADGSPVRVVAQEIAE